MDEEQSNKKINISSFFERVDSVDEVASNALSKSNANFSAINNLQMLIQNISMSINEIRNDVREIANYIIVEKKLEMDRQLDEKFEAQDEKQKKEMLDRAKALGQPAPSTPQQKEEPVTAPKGGFLSGLLKAIAVGGIVALAAPLIPVIAPLLLKAMAIGIGVIALKIVGKEILKLLPKIGDKIKESAVASMKFAKESVEKLNAKFNDLANSVGKFLSKRVKQTLDLGKNIFRFGKKKIGQMTDLVSGVKDNVDKKTKFLDKPNEKKVKVIRGEKDLTDEDIEREIADQKAIIQKMEEEGRNQRKIDYQKRKLEEKEGILEFRRVGLPVKAKRKFKFIEEDQPVEVEEKSEEKKTGFLQGIKNLADKTASLISLQTDLGGMESGKTDSGTGLQPVVQADAPRQSMASLLPTKSPVPFIKVLDNSYLSKVPTRSNMNEIPPEIAKLIA